MELNIKLHHKNSYPLGGILIKGAIVEQWLKEIQCMQLSLSAITVYPVPSAKANTLWGCLVTCNTAITTTDTGRNAYSQVVNDLLYLPEKAILYPILSNAEINALFKGKKHVMHPEFGLAELEEPVDWTTLIELPSEAVHAAHEPASGVFIPGQIKTFQVKPVAIEEALSALEEKHFPAREKFTDKPLNLFEKGKLLLYKGLFTKNTGAGSGSDAMDKSPLLSALESIKKLFSPKETDWTKKLQTDYEDLERRNQKHFDRLMDLLKNNPEEALKYAIPLDSDGTARGSGDAAFDMQKRWFDFSLFGSSDTGGGHAIFPDDAFNQLRTKYMDIAQELIKQKDYRKAAFVYMKLLKNYMQAAQALEEGGFYQEAASVYLKYCNNKSKAAACFEKGNMTANAIELYKELNQYEKVGDLYYSVHNKKEAYVYYQKVVDDHTQYDRYKKAALVCKNKMNDVDAAQKLLLTGWRSNKDAFICLQNYFGNISDTKQLAGELHTIYHNDVSTINREIFLQLLKHEYHHHPNLSASIKEMAYEIVVEHIPVDSSIVSELRAFNKDDKQLLKDTMRFRVNRRKTGQ